MSKAKGAVLAFAAPAGLLGLTLGAAWLSTTTMAVGNGPMRLLPFVAHPAATPIPPEPDQLPPTTLEKLSPLQAELRNALIPFTRAAALAPAQYRANDGLESPSATLQCLASAVYYEAGQEPTAGQRAVAQVIINRWASAPFPKTICGVVQQGAPHSGCQFTFECDGSLSRTPAPAAWASARKVAETALSGAVDPDVGLSTHYHADYVVPVWASTMLKLTKIGRHIFYRWAGARPVISAVSDLPQPLSDPFGIPSLGGPVVSPTTATPPPPTPTVPDEVSRPATSLPDPLTSYTKPPVVLSPVTPTTPAPTPPAYPAAAEPDQQESLRTAPPRRAVPNDSLRQGPL